jgi:hypothetical protein
MVVSRRKIKRRKINPVAAIAITCVPIAFLFILYTGSSITDNNKDTDLLLKY